MTISIEPRLGILGGMGPLATADFLQKLIAETPAARDEEHIPVIVYSVPQIPSRPAAIVGGGPSPLPAMLEGVRTLKSAGARIIAIPCNTAHHWHDALVSAGGLPIIHIVDAVRAALCARASQPRSVGLIATKGTLAAGFFQRRLSADGHRMILSSEREQDEWVLPAIEAVKRNALDVAHPLAIAAVNALLERGAETVVLACTETPLAIDYRSHVAGSHCLDATRALAKACVAWWQERGAGRAISARFGQTPFGSDLS